MGRVPLSLAVTASFGACASLILSPLSLSARMSDVLKARRLQKLLGNSNAVNHNQAGPSKRRHGEWNILRQSETVASIDLDKFDLCNTSQTSAPSLPRPLLERAAGANQTKPPARECNICRDSDVEFSSAPPTDRCLHQPESCISCIAQTIKTAIINRSNSSNIRCPSTDCDQLLAYDDVRHGLRNDSRTFERYNELLLQRLLQQDEGYVTCLNAACGAGQVHAGQNIFPIVTCYKCGAKTCYKHRVEWHEGYSCKEWDNREERWAREDVLSREWVDGQTKRCPGRGCNRPIKKDEGCDHMTCRRPGGCGHEFCWVCLAPYAPIRAKGCEKHKPSCRYYSGPAPVPAPVVPAPPTPPTNLAAARSRWQFWRREAAEIPIAPTLL